MFEHEYVTDYLDAPVVEKRFTKGENEIKTFESKALMEKEIIRRARAVIGFRGIKNPDRVKINCTMFNMIRSLTASDDDLAAWGRMVAEDTLYWDIEYF